MEFFPWYLRKVLIRGSWPQSCAGRVAPYEPQPARPSKAAILIGVFFVCVIIQYTNLSCIQHSMRFFGRCLGSFLYSSLPSLSSCQYSLCPTDMGIRSICWWHFGECAPCHSCLQHVTVKVLQYRGKNQGTLFHWSILVGEPSQPKKG